MKHTSICLDDAMHAAILNTGKPLNSVINEALKSYFSGVPIEENKIQEAINRYLESEKMQVFFNEAVKETLIPLFLSYMPKHKRDEIAKELARKL